MKAKKKQPIQAQCRKCGHTYDVQNEMVALRIRTWGCVSCVILHRAEERRQAQQAQPPPASP